jgi:hypothetical protein
MKKLLIIFLFSLSINAHEASLVMHRPSKGVMLLGIQNPPVGRRFGLMVSYDLKVWTFARDIWGVKCIRAIPSDTPLGHPSRNLTYWHFLITQKQAFFKIAK